MPFDGTNTLTVLQKMEILQEIAARHPKGREESFLTCLWSEARCDSRLIDAGIRAFDPPRGLGEGPRPEIMSFFGGRSRDPTGTILFGGEAIEHKRRAIAKKIAVLRKSMAES